MSRARKTIDIDLIKAEANAYFRNSANEFSAVRYQLQFFVGNLLHKANAYHGFRYLVKEELPANYTFGIDYSKPTEHCTGTLHDESRISFH